MPKMHAILTRIHQTTFAGYFECITMSKGNNYCYYSAWRPRCIDQGFSLKMTDHLDTDKHILTTSVDGEIEFKFKKQAYVMAN